MKILNFFLGDTSLLVTTLVFAAVLGLYIVRYSRKRLSGSFEVEPKRQMAELVIFMLTVAVGFVWLIKVRTAFSGASLISLVDTIKLFSLLISIAVGGEIAIGINENHKSVKRANVLVIFGTSLVFAGLFVKVVNDGQLQMDLFEEDTVNLIDKNLVYFSIFPIAAYFFIDLHISRKGASRGSNADTELIEYEKLVARRFVVYSDIPAIFPLFLVFSITIFELVDFSKPERDIFLSGAMAVVIISHTLCSKAVDVYNPAINT